MRETARKHALKNAFEYGSAQPGNVAGKVAAEFPEARKDMKAAMKVIAEVVGEVNSLGKGEVESELSRYEFAEKREEAKRWELPGAEEGKVVTRFLPEPNGYPHMGHAKAAWISAEFARQWGGSVLLRFDDTNPEAEKPEFVDAIREGIAWLGIVFSRESFTSDFMPRFYDCAEQLVKQGDAYVCTCTRERISAGRRDGKACACRDKPSAEDALLWKKMASGGFGGEEAILRLKGDMASLNTVMRDPALFRVVKTPHFRQGAKYPAWPTYDFEVSIADSLDGITHAMRSKEYELRDELYYEIAGRLGLRAPHVYDFSRLNLKGTVLSKRFIKPLIEEGKVSGWDDPRMPTLAGVRRRGILPEAIRRFVLSFGLSKVESEPGWDALLNENKKLLDPVSEHYYFVPDPVRVSVRNATRETAMLKKLHSPDSGLRAIPTTETFFIPKADAESLALGETVRLKDLFNVEIRSFRNGGIDAEFAGNAQVDAKKIQWVSEPNVAVSVVEPGALISGKEFNPGSWKKVAGLAEPETARLEAGAIVQFERYGFCRLDKKTGGGLEFILSCR